MTFIKHSIFFWKKEISINESLDKNQILQNFNDWNTDGPFTSADSNSFWRHLGILPIAQEKEICRDILGIVLI